MVGKNGLKSAADSFGETSTGLGPLSPASGVEIAV